MDGPGHYISGKRDEAVWVPEAMTLRDTFAAAALTGILACQTENYALVRPLNHATWAYELADAMLEARTKTKETQP